jgi:hypothetical protein
MMRTDPTRRSALSVALLAHAGTDWAWFTIQGRPAALRELAQALLGCAELTEQTYPAPAAPVVEEVAG